VEDIEKDVAAIRQIEAIPAILEVAAKVTRMGYVVVTRVTETRWVACAVLDNIDFGLEAGGELPVRTTLCSEVRVARQEVVIDDVSADPVYANHHTPAIYGLQSYISIPIILKNGDFFGTLCAIDPAPHKPSEAVGMFRLFAQLIAFHLDAAKSLQDSRDHLRLATTERDSSRASLAASEQNLMDSQAGSELREQFVAVLGHDLRNPLAAIEGGRRLLEKEHVDPKSARILRLMGESVRRMSGLIDNVMDFARGRLGNGIGIERVHGTRIEPLLAQVINEIKTAHPAREISIQFDLDQPVDVDHARIAQMFSNLLGNAVTHGAEDQPIEVRATVVSGQFELSVANGGDPIPPAAMERLFQPFYRGEVRPSMQGLGLGLYIASQIAQAHGGRIDVTSDASETRFVFRMPLA
jgi:signal transduction histidine kinase